MEQDPQLVEAGVARLQSELKAVQRIIDLSSEFLVNYGFQLLGAVIILLLGWYAAAWLGRVVLALCKRAELDVTLSKFFVNIAKTVVLVFVVIIALGKFGITITPFIAAIGAVAFGGTLAFQSQLSNYGAGLNLILTRPFVVGDTITVQGVTGVVEDVRLAYTQLSNEDAEVITIPNRHIVGEVIRNSFASLVVESSVGIGYASNPESAVALIARVLQESAGVAREPPPQVGIRKFGESAIEIGYRYWVPTRRFYQTQYAANARIFSALKEAGISIPSPRWEVRLVQEP